MTQIITRRRLVAAAPVTVVVAALPALSASAHPDAGLLALRGPWRAAVDAFEAALTTKSSLDAQVFARSESYPDWNSWAGSGADFTAICARITAKREAIEAELGGDEADRIEDASAEANGALVEQIETTPARTFAGLLFKVEVSEEENHNRPELIDSIMADIKALASGGFDA